MKIYHNPRCSTSRKALAMLTDAGIEPEVILYMKNPLTPKKMATLLRKLKMEPLDLMRKKEELFKSEYAGKDLKNAEWIEVMINNPKLMERPILELGRKAELGRPLDNLKLLIEKAKS